MRKPCPSPRPLCSSVDHTAFPLPARSCCNLQAYHYLIVRSVHALRIFANHTTPSGSKENRVSLNTAKKNAETVEITGTFNAKAFFDALHKEGLSGIVATEKTAGKSLLNFHTRQSN